MRRSPSLLPRLGAATLLVALLAAPSTSSAEGSSRGSSQGATAEDGERHWIVTTEGDSIETEGPWRIEGDRVLFTAPNGTLVSMRLEQVDLEASRDANRPLSEAGETSAQPSPPEREREKTPPRLVLTDRDLPPMTIADRGRADDEAETRGDGASASDESSGLTVVEWRNVAEVGDPLQIYGTLRNAAGRPREGIGVVVVALDQDDAVLGRQVAVLQQSALQGNQSTSFRASFPELRGFDRIAFETSSR